MASFREQFEMPSKTKTWSLALIAVGALALIIGLVTKGFSSDEQEKSVFWGTLMYNSIFFTLICNASMFFICATTLAMGGWQMVFRRVPEAISKAVITLGSITWLILFYIIVIDHNHHIYHWLSEDAKTDPILKGKLGFLNPTFFLIWTTLAIGLWILLGARMRKLSSEADEGAMDAETGKN